MDAPSAIGVQVPIEQKLNTHAPSDGINAEAPHKVSLEQQYLSRMVDEAVNKALSRVERLFQDQKVELATKEAAAEKALKSRKKKEKKERAEERKELVEAIREMALELEDRDPDDSADPVVLKDAVGRRFIFPFEACRTWRVSLLEAHF